MAKKSKPSHSKKKLTNGFYPVPRYLVRSKIFIEAPFASKALFWVLLDLRNECNMINPRPAQEFHRSDALLMKDTGMNRLTLRRARRGLEDMDLICVRLGRYTGTATTYIILDECAQIETECEWPF